MKKHDYKFTRFNGKGCRVRHLTDHEVASWFERLEQVFAKRLPKPHHTAVRGRDDEYEVGHGRVRYSK